jgi:DNA-binding transcriptional MerR regulator
VTGAMTIDQLAVEAGTTTRHVRTLQTMGLLPRPALRARTGLYGTNHLSRLRVVLELQGRGFTLRSLSILFGAHDRGSSLASVLGLEQPERHVTGEHDADDATGDSAELYGFAPLQPHQGRGKRPLLWVVPTTMWDESPTSGVA